MAPREWPAMPRWSGSTFCHHGLNVGVPAALVPRAQGYGLAGVDSTKSMAERVSMGWSVDGHVVWVPSGVCPQFSLSPWAWGSMIRTTYPASAMPSANQALTSLYDWRPGVKVSTGYRRVASRGAKSRARRLAPWRLMLE